MKTSDYLLLGAAAVAAIVIYKQFVAPNKEAAKDTIRSTADAVFPSVFTPNAMMSVYENSDGSSTTYKWTQEDLNKLNFAQRLLLNIGLPDEWVLQ